MKKPSCRRAAFEESTHINEPVTFIFPALSSMPPHLSPEARAAARKALAYPVKRPLEMRLKKTRATPLRRAVLKLLPIDADTWMAQWATRRLFGSANRAF